MTWAGFSTIIFEFVIFFTYHFMIGFMSVWYYLLYILDMSCVKIGIGSACNSKSFEPSYVLKAIGLSDEDAMRTIRFTLPEDITYEDIRYTIKEIDRAIKLIEEINGD